MKVMATVDVDEYDENTMQQEIVRAAVKQLVSDVSDALQKETRKALTHEIHLRTGALIEATISTPVAKTNQWGEATGSMTTLREQIMASAEKYLTEPVNSRGEAEKYKNDKSITRAMWLVRTQAAAVIDKQFQEQIKSIVDDFRQQLAGDARALIAKAINSIVGGKALPE